MGYINNFNVLVGGSNVLHQDSRYTYQQFNYEFFHEFGINGNQSSGLGSSLIDFKGWLKKPYYYVNCSRVPMEQQNAIVLYRLREQTRLRLRWITSFSQFITNHFLLMLSQETSLKRIKSTFQG